MNHNPDTSSKSEKFLTVREAAKLLKVSTQTIKNYIYSGKIKSFKTPGGQHRILASDLPGQAGEFFVEKQKEMPDIFESDIREMRRTYLLTLRTLLRALDKKDSVPAGHSERVARYSIMIADETEIGEDIIKQIKHFGTTAPLVRHHHERFDGSGYPDGLMDGQIPLGSRIISVAEVYDFLVSPLSFRSPFTSEEAVSELRIRFVKEW